MFRGLICICALTFATAAVGAQKPSAADVIAQKFAEQSQPAQTPDTTKSATVKKAEPAKIERPTLDYEMEMLRRARAEQAGEKAAPTAAAPLPVAPKPEPPKIAPVAASPAAATQPEQAAPADVAPVMAPAAPVASTVSPAAAAPPPVAPAKAAEVAPPAATPQTEVQAKVDPKPSEPAKAVETTAVPAARASLLLAIETGGTASKDGPAPTYDPMICMGDTCFVSAGLNSDAVKLSKLDALKLKTTTEASPDSCKGKIACVFRNVAVPPGAQVQVIELGSATHDPVRALDAKLDSTCKLTAADLTCDNPILTTDFKIWVVPEETARTAGVVALEEAVADGLPHVDVARATDK
jgi:hypothetical protein